MPCLKLDLENCYGIRKLEHSFDLGKHEGRGGAFSIYAPNGVMKSSLARTFKDYADERDSKDLIFPSRATTREIYWDEKDLDPKTVFVIKPYVESYESETVSTLIANPALQEEYSTSVKALIKTRKTLTDELKKLSGISSRTETPDLILMSDLGASEGDFPEKIQNLLDEEMAVDHLDGVKYAEVFNPNTLKVLTKNDFQESLTEYVDLYNRLVDESPILCRTFNHQGASSVCKGLNDSGFYTAGHSVTLENGASSKVITTHEELDKTFQQEHEKILADKDLKKRFEAVDKSLGNVDTKRLRALVEDNKELLADLSDLEILRKKLWYSYLRSCGDELKEFLKCSQSTKDVLEQLIASAKEEETQWKKVIDIFNRRFDVPFNVSIGNQAEVILKGAEPVKVFSFSDRESSDEVDEKTLLSVLSQGERRALYILNLLFEIETRKASNEETLFIVDDIADSFDYRNKYAIVEYLRDLSQRDEFYFLFLTHNFDFHRTISSRLGLQRNKRLVGSRGAETIDLRVEKYQKDVFAYWRDHMGNNERMFLACIPFVRNLADYSGQDAVFESLTEVLHIKSNSKSKTFRDVISDYGHILQNLPAFAHDNDVIVLDKIQAVSIDIVSVEADHIDLEEKIILAMAIRLMAEEYMLKRLNNPDWEEPSSNQTRVLFDEFAGSFGSEEDVIATLDQVNLMTPENIHINSFMFEPILDMSPGHLYRLYKDLKILIDALE
ncbi:MULTISPECIES: hypothetical protein [unclassified Microbulbifer]|uniref:hypothetical protein n=1 Tax=unclassified Microbulbifer TaxID=2619833 RepID=UPI0027E40B8B|nr:MULTISPECIES: hypothetical protein [unclassified Microbulbifer]